MEAGYYAVIPADVRYDAELRPNAKLLYGELTSLCGKTGYCWATNEYFAQLYGLAVGTISRLISQLEERGYIRCEMAATAKGSERRIYAGAFLVQQGGVDKNVNTPVDEKVKGGLDENVKENNTSMNNKYINTPYSPPEGDGPAEEPPKGDKPGDRPKRSRCRKVKSEPEWEPERFKSFWDYYGLKVNRARAIAEWDALRPDDELIAHMGRTLKRQKQSEQWRRGIGIPHPARWLRERRWEDEDVGPCELPPEDAGGWAEDPEVV